MRTNETCSLRIINGEEAEMCSWPWQAALLEKKGLSLELFCGGVIYNEEWIITTASCVSDKQMEVLEVEVGEFILSGSEGSEQLREVEEIVVHPNYNESNNANDIALLRLSSNLNLDYKFVAPVCMAEIYKNYSSYEAVATGWGHDGAATIQDHLMELTVEIQAACLETDQFEGQFCASSATDGNVCTHDEVGLYSLAI